MKKLITPLFLLFTSLSFCQTTVTLSPTADDELYSFEPDKIVNSTSLAILQWTNGGAISNKHAVLNFDFSQIPDGAIIESATLSLFHNAASADQGHSTLSGSNRALIYRVNSSWDEQTITWNTQPTYDNSISDTIPASTSSTQDYLDINVTATTTEIIKNKQTSHGYFIKMEIEDYYRSLTFASRNHPNADLHPVLSITYTQPVINGFESVANNNSIQISPNPVTNNTINIKLKNNTPFSVKNTFGQQILEGNINNQKIDISSLTNGIYILIVNNTRIKFLKD